MPVMTPHEGSNEHWSRQGTEEAEANPARCSEHCPGCGRTLHAAPHLHTSCTRPARPRAPTPFRPHPVRVLALRADLRQPRPHRRVAVQVGRPRLQLALPAVQQLRDRRHGTPPRRLQRSLEPLHRALDRLLCAHEWVGTLRKQEVTTRWRQGGTRDDPRQPAVSISHWGVSKDDEFVVWPLSCITCQYPTGGWLRPGHPAPFGL